MQSTQSNKDVVISFYQQALRNGDIAVANTIIADDYIQHSTRVKPGKAGVLEAIAYFATLPKPATTTPPPVVRILSEKEYVVVHMSVAPGGKKIAVADVFRLHNNQLAEHWDVMQPEPPQTASGHPLVDGPTTIEDASQTAANKLIVEQFHKTVLMVPDAHRLIEYVSDNVIQHDPRIPDGRVAWQTFLQTAPPPEAIQHIIAEGNFVAIHTTRQVNIYRLAQGKIAEHWCVKE